MTDPSPAPAEGDVLRRLALRLRKLRAQEVEMKRFTGYQADQLMLIADELDALAPLAAPVDASGEPERKRISDVLTKHWIVELRCNHDLKTDQAFCACATWKGPELLSVGSAVRAWADHVADELAAAAVPSPPAQEMLSPVVAASINQGASEPPNPHRLDAATSPEYCDTCNQTRPRTVLVGDGTRICDGCFYRIQARPKR